MNLLNEKALELLKQPNLLDYLITECSRFIAGEEKTIKTIILYASGRLIETAQQSSYNLFINDESGAGKDYVTEKVLKVIVPKDKLLIRSRISPTALTYWHTKETEPEWTWNAKVLFLKDVSENVLNSEVIKLFMSDETITTVTRYQKAKELEIEGKPVLFFTSYSATPEFEQIRRLSYLQMDLSEEQTQKIKEYQAWRNSFTDKIEINETIQDAMSYLDRVKVVIPYADKIVKNFPNLLISRTALPKFLDLVKASVGLYQHQRKYENGFFVAQAEDYELAREVFEGMSTNKKLMYRSNNQKKIMKIINEELDKNVEGAEIINREFWSAKEVADRVGFMHFSKVYENLDKLCEAGFLRKSDKRVCVATYGEEGSDNYRQAFKEVKAYRIVDCEFFKLCDFVELMD